MAANGVEQPPERTSVERELARIAASDTFRKAERCLRLLRYLTDQTLEGRGGELKEYAIGLAVLERPESFDPRTDAAVRLEARRLRLKLAEYYLQDGLHDPVVIELPKGTYTAHFRFREPVPAKSEPAGKATGRRSLHPALALAVLVFLALIAALAFYSFHAMALARLPNVAVLPFRDNSPSQSLDYFAGGFRDGLTNALVNTKGLEVTARAPGHAVDPQESPVEAARRLHADTIVSGSVSPAGSEIQVVVALVDAKTARYLWSKTYQATAADLPLIEHSAALGISRALGSSAEVPVPTLPSNPEAAELYLHATALARTRVPASMLEAARLYERVIRLQPDYAPAYAATASNCLVGVQNGAMRWHEVGAECMELAQKAIDLDPSLADAHAARALGWQAQWKWQECEAELARAIQLDPRSPVPHFRRAYTLTVLHRFSEASRELETARGLDPSWVAPHGLLGELYFYERRYDDALDLARRFRTIDPVFFDSLAGRVYVAQKRWAMAQPLLLRGSLPLEQDLARAASGDVEGAYQDLIAKRRTSTVTAYHIASFTALQMHDRKVTLDWLEQSLEEREPDLVSLALDPMFDEIRRDPRAAAILKQLNLAGNQAVPAAAN